MANNTVGLLSALGLIAGLAGIYPAAIKPAMGKGVPRCEWHQERNPPSE